MKPIKTQGLRLKLGDKNYQPNLIPLSTCIVTRFLTRSPRAHRGTNKLLAMV